MNELCKIADIKNIKANCTGLIFIDLNNGEELTTESDILFIDGVAYENE